MHFQKRFIFVPLHIVSLLFILVIHLCKFPQPSNVSGEKNYQLYQSNYHFKFTVCYVWLWIFWQLYLILFRTFNRSGNAWTVALDILKDFYRIWHSSFLYKPKSRGISDWFCAHIVSFLSSSRLRMVLDCKSSHEYSVNACVLQKLHSWAYTFSTIH